jgi:hypothetical protein
MLKPSWPLFLVVLICFGGPIVAVLSSADFQYCISHQGQYPTAQGMENKIPVVLISGGFGLFSSCVASFADANGIAITAVATVLLALITGGLVWTAYLQIRTSRVQLRAYVFPMNAVLVEGTVLVPPRADRKDYPGIVIDWRNTGQTPAYKVVTWARIEIIEPINEEKLVVPHLDPIHHTSLGAGANGTKSLWFERALSASEIDDIGREVKGIYLFGRIEYLDIFNEQRFSNFRLKYTGAFPPRAVPAGFLLCRDGNDSN